MTSASICDGLPALLDRLKGSRVGLIANHASVTAGFLPLVDVLRDAPGVTLAALFAPEHGFYGEMDVELDAATDPRTGLPIHSLYGARRGPTAEMLDGVDALLFSIQDVGVRFYTYISTMLHSMRSAAACGIPFFVLDRPNPITGVRLEGNVTEPALTSFVSVVPLPIRHGMTIGELALLFNEVHGVRADLTVARMPAWDRRAWFDATGWPWVMPSPAMPSLDTAIVYPGTCLYEGMNLAIGRGTSRPFELIGAPWIDPFGLADAMNAKALPGALFRPTYFIPASRTFKNERCAGIHLHVTDRQAFEPVRAAMHLLVAIRSHHPDRFDWGPDDRLNRKMGSAAVKRRIEEGVPVEAILAGWAEERKSFEALRQDFLIY